MVLLLPLVGKVVLFTVLGHVVSMYTFIYWCYYTLLLKGSHISMLIASMSYCTVCRLENVIVIGGFRVGYCSSSSIYLYIGDVVLRVGSYLGLT